MGEASPRIEAMAPAPAPTMDHLPHLLQRDSKVKLAGIDCDGVLRGKIMSKEKFLSSFEQGFGMSSAIFGWDMHDLLYTTETTVTSAESGYADLIAVPDINSYRRIPWEDDIPLFLLHFTVNAVPLHVDGRSILRSITSRLQTLGYSSKAGVELEFFNYQTPSEDGYGASLGTNRQDMAAFLSRNTPGALRPLTQGMFGYSLTRQAANKRYFHDIYDSAERFQCNIEAWHTESGPGVYEAALAVADTCEIADRVTLFKYLAKSVGIEHRVTPCFMAKPTFGLPGNSGHIHISLYDLEGRNLFARDSPDPEAQWRDIEHLSDDGRYFLAGLLNALPDIMPMFAPTINSYKRLVENYWAPVNVSWGLEDRLSSIRLIAPPVAKPQATRFEVRIPGADLHPHYALSAILGAGLRGIESKMSIPIPPTALRKDKPELLPNSLLAANDRFRASDSIAREIFDGKFVDHFAASREHEIRVWKESVTDWEFRRYIETV